jgi:hypothetical protein
VPSVRRHGQLLPLLLLAAGAVHISSLRWWEVPRLPADALLHCLSAAVLCCHCPLPQPMCVCLPQPAGEVCHDCMFAALMRFSAACC